MPCPHFTSLPSSLMNESDPGGRSTICRGLQLLCIQLGRQSHLKPVEGCGSCCRPRSTRTHPLANTFGGLSQACKAQTALQETDGTARRILRLSSSHPSFSISFDSPLCEGPEKGSQSPCSTPWCPPIRPCSLLQPAGSSPGQQRFLPLKFCGGEKRLPVIAITRWSDGGCIFWGPF
jgi:hypothetical protein